ncbi:hypothetical protein A2926_01595 [Candidatus Giovannonibacteria bacterium RIFCSPLOWO2_01_FULL_44_40]|uniref:Uncharacterized protein n=1 Tax=Candidatus Giovannonibacteria bacterium RIFCSPHIGHO2_01_FULL_45_23 TaxID=1798325 RepID=A0A1F5VF06_9BACT|nr:MAG: hypothetical protein A2834_01785 [Candidatus Giovannonibacteria bacterium RIFCSPHIGHO2_01_FULL_45_23]OGF75119.1 MAG: hypothetical protein A3C77_01085 [Candidatus Giovannonibacteria bacterium RIFCSPHIGHO2_02_FULL_45_13]OGF79688.1 MAG: hypothetical protein A2926_01595 [Candidatus Giovannonibacteria bacterium RIFCSPLOWO2_01_FULL_44_40]
MAKSVGLRVTVIICGSLGQETRFSEITYQNRNPITVHEILRHFAISAPRDGSKIWIKRADSETFRKTRYEMNSQLPWDEFNNCVIVIAPDLETAKNALNPPRQQPIADPLKAFEENLERQKRLWREKRQAKEARGPCVPRSLELKNQKISAIVRKKRKARLEALKKTEENDKNTPDS